MKEFMRFIFIEPFEDMGIVGVIFGIIIWPLCIIVAFLISYGIFYVVDSSFLEQHQGVGIIVEKWHEDSYIYYTYIHSGKVTIPVMHHAPESWHVKVFIKDAYDSMEIRESAFDQMYDNQKVDCQYVHGRFSDYIYIKSISF